MKENIIQQKSFAFAIRVVNAYKYLTEQKKEFVLSKQLLRSGTSIGANVEEARETKYWLNLLTATDYLDEKLSKSLLDDAEELCKILSSILLTTKQNNS